jgi:CheY-like chemotaxis protein
MDQNRKILLVDDEQDFREIMAKLFTRKQLGYAVAGGCMEALDLLSKELFDVIIMDISMPGLNGLERSEERRVGKECRRLCRSRWSPYH